MTPHQEKVLERAMDEYRKIAAKSGYKPDPLRDRFLKWLEDDEDGGDYCQYG